MFQWLAKFTTGGNKLTRAVNDLADTFNQLNALVREQTGLARIEARAEKSRLKAKAEVIENKPAAPGAA
jgi:hypothetical protein